MDLIDASLRRPSKLLSATEQKQVDVGKLTEKIQQAINEALSVAVKEARDSMSVTVNAPDVPAINIDTTPVQQIVSRLSADIAVQFTSGIRDVKNSVDTIRGDISKINIPDQEVVKGWSFAGFEYDDEGRIVSFVAEATK